MRFVSHLDLLKIFSRAARRCKLPLSYSQGFNPHPELVFNSPLPLGVTSEAEYVDLSLDEAMEPGRCLALLAGVLPEGIRPVSVRQLAPGEATVMKYVCACQYRMEIQVHGILPEDFVSGIQRLLAGDRPVLIMKKSKSGVKETDIRPMVIRWFDDLSVIDDRIAFTCVTAAGNVTTLRPDMGLEGLAKAAFGEAAQVNVLAIHKLRYYTVDGGSPD